MTISVFRVTEGEEKVSEAENRILEGVDAVLFDFDGTLMDTTDIIIGSWQTVYRTVTGKEGDLAEILGTFGEILRDSLAEKFPGEDVDELVRIYKTWQQDRFEDEVGLFPGVTEMLDELSEKGCRMAIVTSRIKETSLRALRLFGIEDYFDSVITANDCTKHKPDPEPVELALEAMGVRPENAVMVGDTVHDMGCARNAGVRYVMVGWSSTVPGGRPEGEQPDAVIEKAEDLPDIIA